MKKSYLILAMLGLFLAGCNNDSSDDQTVTPPNKLSIKGENIDREVVINQADKQIKFSANGNGPLNTVSWLVTSHSKPELATGFMALHPDQQNFELFYLGNTPESDNPMDALLLDGTGCIILQCKNTTRYQLLEGQAQTTLVLAFNDQQATYIDPASIGLPKPKKSYVKISGDLQFSIPNNWPVLKKQRFPVMNVQGKLAFDAMPYKVSSIEYIPEMQMVDGLKVPGYSIRLKAGDDTIVLEVMASSLFGVSVESFRVIQDDKHYAYAGPALAAGWQENSQELVIKAAHELSGPSGSKRLDANLRIPKPVLQATLNGTALKVPTFYKLPTAHAINEQQVYDIVLGETGTAGSLTLVQELKGHLSLSYNLGEQRYSCGSQQLACAGLTVDADQKTWRFNQVKLGDAVLNGLLYIPGVFE